MFIENRIPCLLAANIIIHPKGTPYIKPLHNHPFCELILITAGSGTIRVDGIQYEITPGTLILYGEEVWHEEQFDERTLVQMLYVSFTNLYLEGIPPGALVELGMPCIFQLSKYQSESWAYRFNELLFSIEQTEESPFLPQSLLGALLAVCTPLLHRRFRPGNQVHQSLHAVKRYIHSHYHQELHLTRLAEEGYLSPFYLIRLFKKETGKTPGQYITAYRLEVAMRYLTTTNLTVEEIVYRVGYHSEPSFYAAFRRAFGETPSNFRERHFKIGN
jgi:AraC-like DNA-binding protein